MMAMFDGLDPFDCEPEPPPLLAAAASLIAGAFFLAAIVAVAVFVFRRL